MSTKIWGDTTCQQSFEVDRKTRQRLWTSFVFWIFCFSLDPRGFLHFRDKKWYLVTRRKFCLKKKKKEKKNKTLLKRRYNCSFSNKEIKNNLDDFSWKFVKEGLRIFCISIWIFCKWQNQNEFSCFFQPMNQRNNVFIGCNLNRKFSFWIFC